jgi:uncharacterized membrane protein
MNIQQNLIAGVFTILPLAAVWYVLWFLFDLLATFGRPWVALAMEPLKPFFPETVGAFFDQNLIYFAAGLFTLALIYFVGMFTTRVIGQQILERVEALIARIPFVQLIYGSTKKVITAFQPKAENVKRVVLVDFPNRDMRALGFVMNTLKDAQTGQELAAVFVPTTPNPTSGYLEFIPSDRLVQTELTLDQAMAMVISGGAISPEAMVYAHNPNARPSENKSGIAAAG